jgi:outer membrane protein assembly factor BamB
MPIRASCCLLALALASAAPISIQRQRHDWPQWQGAERNNRSRETGLLKDWPKDGPPLAWKVTELGGGYSAPSIAAGRIFGMSYRKNDEVVWALDEKTGNPLWSTRIAAANREVDYHEGSRCTPTVEGDHLYALGVSGDLVCLQVRDGKEVWRKNLIGDFDGVLPFYIASYGYAESPLVDGERVVVTPGDTKATIVALDKKSGKTIWTTSVPENGKKAYSRAAYTSITILDVAGTKQYVQFLHGGVVGIAAADGKLLWHYDKPSSNIVNCSTPLVHDGCVFASSGYNKGAGLARIRSDGQGFRADEVYFTKRIKNLHGGFALVDDYIYAGSDPGLLVCMEFATGKVMWDSRAPGKGSIACADGRLYYRDEQGPMFLVEATTRGYVERGRFNPPDRSRALAWSHPVLANGKLYLRDQDVLLCYDVKVKK